MFDVGAGRATDLWEVPLAVMDTTLVAHRGLDDGPLAAAVAAVLDAARTAGGVAVVLWHNDLGGAGSSWSRRLSILDHAVGQALAAGAAVAPLDRLLDAWAGGAGEKLRPSSDAMPVARRSL